MRCSKCGSDNPADKKFCGDCGAPLANRCPQCGADNPPVKRFCGDCGAVLSTQKAAEHSPASSWSASDLPFKAQLTRASTNVDGERKTVTALFADIKGSMELMEDLDPEEARGIVDPALKLMIDAVHHYDGYIVQSTGDGIFALFGAPLAHEDHPQRALYAALSMQDQMLHYSATLRHGGKLPVEARVGLNTGEVVVRSIATSDAHAEYTPIGHSTSLAARMQALAPTGSIAATDATRRLCEGYFTFKSLGPTIVKGVTEPVNVYEVTGLGQLRTRLQRAAARGLTKFVGRQREMDALKHSAEQAQAGRGQVVAVMADPGIGKSRLFYEFKATSQSGWMVLEALSVSHGKTSAYLPVIELLHAYLGIEVSDDGRKRREKVNGRIVTLDPALEDTRPYLFALLGLVEGDDPLAQMDGEVKQRRTQEVIKRILFRESLNQPLLLIFEDLHWIDEETQVFLNLLVDGMADLPVLLLVSYRPEYSHPWSSKTYYTRLRLEPLGRESAEEMLKELLCEGAPLAGSPTPPLARSFAGKGKREGGAQGEVAGIAALKKLIIDKTEGTPFFMEELVQSLFDEGVLVRNGAVKVTRPLSQLKIPPTVQGILASRIDRLAPEAKELLQTLAVIGSEFPLALVREIIQLQPERLDSLLSGLQAGEFVYEQPAAHEIEYSFKHALTHDVAYNSLLTERRKQLHERTAQAIELLYHERLEDQYADLAHHYRSSNNAAKAIEYLCLAGEQAARRGAYAQSLANADPALALIERLPEGPERLRAELGVRLMEGMCAPALYGAGSEERRQTFQRVCDLSEQLGDASALVRGLLNVAGAYLSRGEASRAVKISRQCVELAERSNDPEKLSAALLQLAGSVRISGDLVQASLLFSELMKRVGSANQQAAVDLLPLNIWLETLMLFALTRHLLGSPGEALELSEEALRRARGRKHPFTMVALGSGSLALRYWRREPDAVRTHAEAYIALAEEHGFGEWVAVGRVLRGWAMAERGQAAKGIAELEVNAALVPGMIEVSGIVAQVLISVGRYDHALEVIDQALSRGERTGLHHDDAELHRLKGEALLLHDPSATAEAEICYRRAIEIAHGQLAKWWQLRATLSLARLLRNMRRREEAHDLLVGIYNWFKEGFDLPDLKEAKAMLDELS